MVSARFILKINELYLKYLFFSNFGTTDSCFRIERGVLLCVEDIILQ